MTARLFVCAAIGGILSTSAAFAALADTATLRLGIVGAALAMLVVYDLRERRIPNWIVLPATLICLAFDLERRSDWRGLATALTIVAVLLLLACMQQRALGMGDVKLALLIAVGLPATAEPALISGLLIACVWGCALAVMRRRHLFDVALPLAPFLALGVLVTVV